MPLPLGADPAYLAFLRAVGAEDLGDAAGTQSDVDAVGRSLEQRLPRIAERGVDARRQISGSFESRGLLRSGSHEQGLARARRAEAYDTSDAVGGAGSQIAELTAALVRRRLARQRQGAEQGLAASGRLYAESLGEG